MNILLSSYSINPFHGSEDGIGWNWLINVCKNFNSPEDRIWVITKKFNEKDTRAGIEKAGLKNVELVIVDVPAALNWFREKYSVFHHMYYILWQRTAYNWVKKSGIKFDIIHHVTMGDFRITGCMYKSKDAYTIFGPVGGGQSTPKSLKCYEKYKSVEKFREFINKSRAVSPFYKSRIKKFNAVYAINGETYSIMSKALGKKCNMLVEIAVPEEFRNLNIDRETHKTVKIIFVGRFIGKKGVFLLADVIKHMNRSLPFEFEFYGSGPLKEQLNDFIIQNSLSEKVKICGSIPHSDISKVYSEADIFVMPSLRETGGTVLVEAMAHKLPIVALDMSLCSQFKKYNCGIFVDTVQSREKIIDDFAKAIEKLVKEPALRAEFGQNGCEYVDRELNWDRKFDTVYGKFYNNR